jgi:hypothetical protein
MGMERLLLRLSVLFSKYNWIVGGFVLLSGATTPPFIG